MGTCQSPWVSVKPNDEFPSCGDEDCEADVCCGFLCNAHICSEGWKWNGNPLERVCGTSCSDEKCCHQTCDDFQCESELKYLNDDPASVSCGDGVPCTDEMCCHRTCDSHT